MTVPQQSDVIVRASEKVLKKTWESAKILVNRNAEVLIYLHIIFSAKFAVYL